MREEQNQQRKRWDSGKEKLERGKTLQDMAELESLSQKEDKNRDQFAEGAHKMESRKRKRGSTDTGVKRKKKV